MSMESLELDETAVVYKCACKQGCDLASPIEGGLCCWCEMDPRCGLPAKPAAAPQPDIEYEKQDPDAVKQAIDDAAEGMV